MQAANVAELADALDLGSSGRKAMGVRPSPFAPTPGDGHRGLGTLDLCHPEPSQPALNAPGGMLDSDIGLASCIRKVNPLSGRVAQLAEQLTLNQ